MSDFETSDFDSSMSVSSTSSTHSSMSSLTSDEILDGVLPKDRVRLSKQAKRLRKSLDFADAVQDEDKESVADILPIMNNFRNENMILSDLSLSSSDENLNTSTVPTNSSRTKPRFEKTDTYNEASTEMAQDTPKDASDSQEVLNKHCMNEESTLDVSSLIYSSLSSISSGSSE